MLETVVSHYIFFPIFLQVAGIFRDNSIGKIKVNYVVSRLIIITNKEVSLP